LLIIGKQYAFACNFALRCHKFLKQIVIRFPHNGLILTLNPFGNQSGAVLEMSPGIHRGGEGPGRPPLFLAGESSCLRAATYYGHRMLGSSSEPPSRVSRRQQRRTRHAVFWWVVGSILIVAAVVGLIYAIYDRQLR
jgi:hypothetical protein